MATTKATTQRSPFRSALLGATAGALGAAFGFLVSEAVAAAGAWLYPTPDANIGLGMLAMAAGAATAGVGVWLVLRGLRLPLPGATALTAFAAAVVLWLAVLPFQTWASTTHYGYLADPGAWFSVLWAALRWALATAAAVLVLRPAANRRRTVSAG